MLGDGVPQGGVDDVLEPFPGGGFVPQRDPEGEGVGYLVADHRVDDQPFLVPVGHLPGRYVGPEGAPVDALNVVDDRRFHVESGLGPDLLDLSEAHLQTVLGLVDLVDG